MPSASIKSDSTGSFDSQDPLARVHLMIEKKIRNLDKRKKKLDQYKLNLAEGKKLNDDQMQSVGAFDGVVASLDLCRDLSVQIGHMITENTKLTELEQKKQQEENCQEELERLAQVLQVQDVFSKLRMEEMRQDFILGRNGARRSLDEKKLHQLDELYKLVRIPVGLEREITAVGFKAQLLQAAKNLQSLLDGRNKSAFVGGTTFRHLKALVFKLASFPHPQKHPSASAPPPTDLPSRLPDHQTSSPTETTASTPTNLQKTSSTSPAGAVNGAPTDETLTTVAAPEPLTTIGSAAPLPPGLSAVPTASSPTNLKLTSDPPHDEGLPAQALVSPGRALSTAAELLTGAPPLPSPAHAAFVGSGAAAAVAAAAARLQLDIHDLVSASSFNFLQESHLGPDMNAPTAVYVDPAVVSFGSVKPPTESPLVRPCLVPPTPAPAPPVDPIQSETFVNSSFSPAPPLPVSIPLPTVAANLPEEKTTTPAPATTSWALQEEVDGWGGASDGAGAINGGDSWVDADPDDGEGWDDAEDGGKVAQRDEGTMGRGGSYRGPLRSRGRVMGMFRGGRGNYGSYQGSGGGYVPRGGRPPLASNGGFRGGRGNTFSRGRGLETRGRGRVGGYQGNQIGVGSRGGQY